MTDQHLADLLGLDLTDPEVIATLAEQREITAIRARVREVLTRTGASEGKLVALLGITADKVAALLAGERRFSTYELAAIATHGGTTVEWLCGEYPDYKHVETPDAAWYRALPIEAPAEFEDELAAATTGNRATLLAAWRSTGAVHTDPELLAVLSADSGADAERTPTPDRDGYTIGVYLPPEASDADIDAIMTRVADAVHGHQYEGTWDPFVVGHAGDLLYVDHHPDTVMDFAAHVRATWDNGHGTAGGTVRP